MDINSTSGYSYGSASTKGIAGLASGLDTESQVKEMLAGTQAKIDKQKGLKQQTEWKQEIYRDLITKINTFQTSYFSSTSPTSLTSTSLYNTMSAATESKNFKVTASTTAPVGNTSLEVHQLASNYSLTSADPISGRLAGQMDVAALQALVDKQLTDDRKLVLKVDDKAVSIDLKKFFVDNNGKFVQGNIDAEAMAEEIQKQLKEQAKLDVKISMAGGQFSLESDDADRTISVDSSSSEQALSALGLTASSEAKANRTQTKRTLTSKLNLTPSVKFSATLDDGLQKEITLDVRNLVDGSDNKIDQANVVKELGSAFDKQFGKGVIKVTGNGPNLDISTAIAGRKIVLNKNGSDTLAALGFTNGQSNRIAAYNTLKELQLSTPLQGNRFQFEINGAQFSFSEDDDIDHVLSTINSSSAGVTVVYKPLEDKFVMTANDAGAGRDITMSQTEGNLLNVMFGAGDGTIKTGSKVASAFYTKEKISGTGNVLLKDGADPATLDGVKKGTLTLTVNGKEYTLEAGEKASGDDYELQELLDKLNSELASKLGTTGENKENSTEEYNNIELALDDTDSKKINIIVRNGASVEIAGIKAANDTERADLAKEGNLIAALGLNTGSTKINNLVSEDTTLADAELGGLAEALNIDATTKLSELAEKTAGKQFEVSFKDGRFVVSTKDANGDTFKFFDKTDGTGTSQMKKLFGTEELVLGQASGRNALVEEGRNAIVRIDGMLTERNSNVFSYNGLTLELTGVSKVVEGEDGYLMGTVQQSDGSTGLPSPVTNKPGRWIDTNGYLRMGTKQKDGSYVYSADDQYVTQGTGALTDEPTADTRQYDGLVIRDSTGKVLTGVGINGKGQIISGSGSLIQNRESSTITVTRDTDKLVEGVKGFIDEYNKLITTITEYLNEDPNYRDYAPLTDEQREEMSDKQIELWEEKAKEGLLRRDSILSDFLQSMRTIWYETNSSGYAIYQFGIETGDRSTRGQLTLSADGEATLREMIASDPTGVMNFFANTVDGAAVRVNDVIKSVANVSSGSPGSLVQLAGVKGRASEKNNTLYDQLKSIDERIERLTDQYESEKDRYWKQFNTMEQLISNMNTQSAWLTSQFSY